MAQVSIYCSLGKVGSYVNGFREEKMVFYPY